MDRERLKLEGNEAFKRGEYEKATKIYSDAINLCGSNSKELKGTLLCNRAACHLKTSEFSKCIADCTMSLELNPSLTKSLYRRACGFEGLNELADAVQDLQQLIKVDPKNIDAINMMRKLKARLSAERADSSLVRTILDGIKKESNKLQNGLKELINLCLDDESHALDFGRKNGIIWLTELINSQCSDRSSQELSMLSIRLLATLCNHSNFVTNYVDINASAGTEGTDRRLYIQESGKIVLSSIASLLHCDHFEDKSLQSVIVMVMSVLKTLPIADNMGGITTESLNAGVPVVFPLEKEAAMAILGGFRHLLEQRRSELYSLTADLLCSFVSEFPDYFEAAKAVDTRLETLEDRRERFKRERVLALRSQNHCEWTIEAGLLALLVDHIDSDDSMVRLNASNTVGKFVSFYKNEERLKGLLERYLVGHDEEPSESKRVVEISDVVQSVPACRKRAGLEATLLTTKPELGAWAVQRPGGISQLSLLVATNDLRCQEIAAEVMCLVASTESCTGLLEPLVSAGAVHSLLRSADPGTRAAAASTMTKLSLKARALTEDSAEVSAIMNTILDVLKTANAKVKEVTSDSKKDGTANKLVSFSAMDDVGAAQQQEQQRKEKNKAAPKDIVSFAKTGSTGVTMTSVERAIEALATMAGKSYIKEEIVNGSYRVASCISELVKLDLDLRSTAAYGLTHVLSLLTVTNEELHVLALAEKDITLEQYKQMQELQRIKTKDEEGNIIEEKKEEADADTQDLCRKRIKRIVACGGITTLVKLLEGGSAQTKEAAARALRQICVEESVRGLMIQQGSIKCCTAVANDAECQKKTRLDAAHAIAKSLVTTNPHLLSEHLRLGCIKPLVFLCKETEAGNLQQFEALLALTNVLSCGEGEQNKFDAEKGVHAVHYLMFSDNLMVRRAATEVFCNMPTHESLLKMFRSGDRLKLWLGLCEDWNNGEYSEQEAFLTARAAAGTLASALGDAEVVQVFLKEEGGRTVAALLNSENAELVHRALFMLLSMLESEAQDKKTLAEHLVSCGVVQAIGVVSKLKLDQLAEAAMECARLLSEAMSGKLQ